VPQQKQLATWVCRKVSRRGNSFLSAIGFCRPRHH
jgi:hypothetical protein